MSIDSLSTVKKQSALHRLALGDSQTDISKDLRVSQSTISRLASREESKAIIEAESQRLLQSLPDIVQIMQQDVQSAKKLSVYYSGKQDHEAQPILDHLKTVKQDKDGNILGEDNVSGPLKFYDIVSRRTDKYLQSVGIFPSHAPSIFIQNVYNDNRSSSNVSSIVIDALGKFLDDKMGLGDPVDAQVVDELSTEG